MIVIDVVYTCLSLGTLFISYSVSLFVFFFFNQNTAYEIRIMDWSSDVCSSDLDPERQRRHPDLRPHGGGHDLARAPTGSPTRWVAGPAPLQFQIEPGPCAGFFRFRTGENDTPTPSLRILHP